jgi:carboxylesterase type B
LTEQRKDPTKIVSDSIKAGKPIIFVSINYRLNIFSFGDGKEKNLALKDQQLGIDWVRKNIASFGGDPVSDLRFDDNAKR